MRSDNGRFNAENTVEGRNPILEAIRAGKAIDKLYVARDSAGDGTLRHIVAKAKETGAAVVEVDRRKLDAMSETGAHQGVIATIPAREYTDVDEVLNSCAAKENPLLVVCDSVTDPANLGAIIRSAEAAGADAVVIRERRAVGLTAVVAKTSAGALEHIPVARVANITQLLDKLKDNGFWIYGTSGDGKQTIYQTDLTGAVALVVGSEGDGVSRLALEHCDHVVSIPMLGRVGSLNASAAAAVVLFEAVRQRTTKG